MFINITVFVALTVAGFLLCNVSISALLSSFEKKPKLISVSEELAQKKRSRIVNVKKGLLTKYRENIEYAILASNMKLTWNTYLQMSVLFAAVGVIVGAFFQNVLLSWMLAFCFLFLPGQYIKLKSVAHRRYLQSQVENTLGIITGSYMQSGDIVGAIQMHLDEISDPLRSILNSFVTEVTLNTNITKAIGNMRKKVPNRHFEEWCNCLIRCQVNRNQSSTLRPIVENLSNLKLIEEELRTSMSAIWRDHIMVSAITLSTIPLIRIMNAEWYEYLTETLVGKIMVCITFLVVILSTLYVIKINKPINMEV